MGTAIYFDKSGEIVMKQICKYMPPPHPNKRKTLLDSVGL